MGITVHVEEQLFDGGPPIGLQKALRLIKSPTQRHLWQRTLAAVFVGWVPLTILATVELVLGTPEARTFFSDVGVHAR